MTEKRGEMYNETVYGVRLVFKNQEKFLNKGHSQGQEDKTQNTGAGWLFLLQ